ncbi:hypothetical protein EAH75_08335 [Rhodanobacter glycinis]|nr:hypothetical protein EAH75_08335 [Rhodanobacter glycinis]
MRVWVLRSMRRPATSSVIGDPLSFEVVKRAKLAPKDDYVSDREAKRKAWIEARKAAQQAAGHGDIPCAIR